MESFLNKVLILFVLTVLCTGGCFSQQVTYDWKHVIPGNTYTALCCMATDSAGNIYVGGRLDSTVTFVDTTVTNSINTGFLAKFDMDGNMIWFKQFEYSGTVYSICFDSENKLYISGSYFGKVRVDDTLLYTWDTDTTYYGMFLAKFDSDGNRVWAKTTAGTFYYDSGFGKLKQMTIDKDDNIVVVGYCIKEFQYYDATTPYTKTLDSAWETTPFPHWVYYYDKTNVLVKFNKDGQKLWVKDVGKYQQHYLAIATDYSNNILLTGYFWDDYPFTIDTLTLNASGGENIFIIKYNQNGNLIWAQRGGGASAGPNKAYDIISDNSDNVYITGIIYGNAIEFGGNILNTGVTNHLFLTKFDSSGTVEWFKHYGTDFNASYFDYSLSIFEKNNELFLSGLFYDSLYLGYDILISVLPPSYVSGIFIRFNTNGDLIDAAMDHDVLQCTPIYFYCGIDNNYYVAGNLLGNNESEMSFGRFSDLFLLNKPEIPLKHSNFVIFPNPCNEFFYILSDENIPYKMEIFDISGQIVLMQIIEDNLSHVNISFFSKGFYFVKVNGIVSTIVIN